MPNPWLNRSRLPRGAAAALAALDLREPRLDALGRLTGREWREALDFCDRARLTLALRQAARDAMPQWVRERTDQDAAKNLDRLRRTEELYRAIAARLTAAGVEFLALKGITQWPLFGVRPESRVQYDIDLYSPRESIHAAQAALLACGYQPLKGMEDFPTDHWPALVRKTGWEWSGDFFDPEMPLRIELHFRFWNEELERLRAPGTDGFWSRRVAGEIPGLPILSPADALGYATLHLLRHLLRGSAQAFHVYEIACFLESHAADAVFWDQWRALHSPELRRLEAVGFRMAVEWFGCGMAAIAREQTEQLPAATQAWFADFAASPASRRFHPNKDEIWLHLSLLDSRRDAWSVLRRRLLPGNLPPPANALHIPESEMTWHRRLRRRMRHAAYFASRVRHHAVALAPTAASGARWWWKINALGEQFWTFLAAAVLFNFALFIFVLLYNLYLLDLGFREDFLGVVNGAARAGSVVGTLPAAFLAHRFGLRKSLLATIATTAVVSALRALVMARLPLAGLAFIGGSVFSIWAVIFAPLIAGAVEEKRRPAAFSVFFAAMFAVGIAGNWLGGRLPLWLHGKQSVLLLSAAMAAVAFLPALGLKPAPLPGEGAKVYPRSPFLARYLVPFALWHLATGTFNPFNNVYFARLRFPVERIGSIFSGSQVVQVAAVLLAPVVLRRAGLARGIAWMMAATALGLAGLAAQPPGAAAPLAYIAYMSFQWMSEPGLNTLLMNHVDERERSGASALNYLVAFSAQALAAFGAGALLARFGYGVVLTGAAALAGLAAGLFRMLLGSPPAPLPRAPAAGTSPK